MLSAAAFFFWILCGIRFAPVFFECSGRLERAAFGSALGLILGSWAAFILFLFLGHSPVQRLIFAAPALAIFIYRPDFTSLKISNFFKNPRFPAAAGILILFWLLAAHETVFETPQGIYTGIETNYGDLSENTAFTQYFAWGTGDLQNPLFAGVALKHHFMSNFLASFFTRDGIDITLVFQSQTFLLGILLTLLYGIFVRRFTGSTACAVISPALLFTAGSLVPLFEPKILDGPVVWQNLLLTRIIPQRSFLMGIPALCLVLVLLWDARKNSGARAWIYAGVMTGLMPFLQIFCFMGIFIGGAGVSILKSLRAFFSFILPALALAVPQLFYLTHGASSHSFAFIPGWFESFKNGPVFFVLSWLVNTGFLWPFIFCSLPFLGRERLIFYLPFTLLFAAGNLALLTLDMNNNYNLMSVWFMVSIPVILILFMRLWKIPKIGKVLTVILFLLLSAGGFRQLCHWLGQKPGPSMIIPAHEKNLGLLLREKTRADELVLIHPTFNHPVFWSGRAVWMGYRGWVWSHGWGDFDSHYKILDAIYTGAAEAENYLRDYKIRIIFVGQREKRSHKVNTAFLEKIADKILESGGNTAYRVK